MKTTKKCPICGQEFTRIHTAGKVPIYCSRACANKAPGRMTEEIKKRIGQKGEENPNFKGGWKGRSGNKRGREYFFVWVAPEDYPKHPTVNKRGYIHRSHYVWNIYHPDNVVKHGQVVHHINGDSLDDRIENLCKVQSQREHLKDHHAEDWEKARNRKRDNNGRYTS